MDKSREPAIDTFYELIFMKFAGNAHNTMPYKQVTCARHGIKYKLACIDNDYV